MLHSFAKCCFLLFRSLFLGFSSTVALLEVRFLRKHLISARQFVPPTQQNDVKLKSPSVHCVPQCSPQLLSQEEIIKKKVELNKPDSSESKRKANAWIQYNDYCWTRSSKWPPNDTTDKTINTDFWILHFWRHESKGSRWKRERGKTKKRDWYKSAIKIQKQFKIHIKTKLKFTDPISRCSGKTKNP